LNPDSRFQIQIWVCNKALVPTALKSPVIILPKRMSGRELVRLTRREPMIYPRQSTIRLFLLPILSTKYPPPITEPIIQPSTWELARLECIKE